MVKESRSTHRYGLWALFISCSFPGINHTALRFTCGANFHNHASYTQFEKFIREKLTATSAADNTLTLPSLKLISSPVESPTADFIFVLGLGGGRKKTWSKRKTRPPKHTWLQEWLPKDPAFRSVRIHTYLFSSDTKGKAEIWNLHDLGKGLLSELSTSALLADAEVSCP